MNNNLIRQKSENPKKYTNLNDEILFAKNISNEVLGVFWRIMSFGKDWKMSLNGLAKVCNCTKEKMRNILKELQTYGYMKIYTINEIETGRFNRIYYVRDSITDVSFPEEIENQIEVAKNMDENETQEDEKVFFCDSPDPDFPNAGNPNAAFADPYIINKDKLINNTTCKYLNNKYYLDIQTNISKNNNSKDLDKNQHEKNSTSSFSLKDLSYTTKNINKQDQHNSHKKKIDSIMSLCKKDQNMLQDQAARVKKGNPRSKNKVQEMEEQNKGTIRSIDTQECKKLSDLLSEDNEVSNMVRLAKELIAQGKSVTKTALTKKRCIKRMKDYISKKELDADLLAIFADYIEVRIEKVGQMSEKSVDLLLEDLFSMCNNDLDLMKATVREATKLGWGDFYLTDKIKQQAQKAKLNSSINIEDENQVQNNKNDEYDYAYNEDGSIVTFY